MYEDLHVPHLLAGYRALGLVGKLVVDPVWEALFRKENVLVMNGRYQELVRKLREWQVDGASLLTGEVTLFEDIAVHDSPVLNSLTRKTDIDFDGLSVQAVEIVLASLVKVCSSMLADHLVHGRYADVSEETG